MGLKLRLDLGLGSQPLKLAAVIAVVWAALALAVFHDRLGGPWDAGTRDMLILLSVPILVVLACVGVLRLLSGGRG